MTVIMNAGTEPLIEAREDRASANMRQFADEVKFRFGYDHVSVAYMGDPDEGRFPYRMTCDGNEYMIDMPGLPLEQVRYMARKDQSIWLFPRLLVDGDSWLWDIALRMCGVDG